MQGGVLAGVGVGPAWPEMSPAFPGRGCGALSPLRVDAPLRPLEDDKAHGT